MTKKHTNDDKETSTTTVVEGGGGVVVYDTPEELDRFYEEVATNPDISGVVVFVPREEIERPVRNDDGWPGSNPNHGCRPYRLAGGGGGDSPATGQPVCRLRAATRYILRRGRFHRAA